MSVTEKLVSQEDTEDDQKDGKRRIMDKKHDCHTDSKPKENKSQHMTHNFVSFLKYIGYNII